MFVVTVLFIHFHCCYGIIYYFHGVPAHPPPHTHRCASLWSAWLGVWALTRWLRSCQPTTPSCSRTSARSAAAGTGAGRGGQGLGYGTTKSRLHGLTSLHLTPHHITSHQVKSHHALARMTRAAAPCPPGQSISMMSTAVPCPPGQSLGMMSAAAPCPPGQSLGMVGSLGCTQCMTHVTH